MNSKYWGCGNVWWSYIRDCLVAGYAANDVPSGQPAAAAGTHLHHPIRSGYSAYCNKSKLNKKNILYNIYCTVII